ncbi:unnamed protein product, partial [Arabidopsis halleri]
MIYYGCWRKEVPSLMRDQLHVGSSSSSPQRKRFLKVTKLSLSTTIQ